MRVLPADPLACLLPTTGAPHLHIMRVAISPYDISARTVAAAAAPLLVGSTGAVVTLRPEPLEGADAATVTRASRDVPAMAAFLDSWTWTRSFWQRGLLRSGLGDRSPIDAVKAVCGLIQTDPELAPLAQHVRTDLFQTTAAYLRAVLADLAVGRGNPQVTIPIEAGMERFASSFSVPLLRTEVSRPGRPQAHQSGLPVCRFSIPVLMNADAEAITGLLDQLDAPPDHLAHALGSVTGELYAHGQSGLHLLGFIERLHSTSDAFSRSAIAAAADVIERTDADHSTPKLVQAQIVVRLCSAMDSLRTAAAGFRRLSRPRATHPDRESGSTALSHPATERLVLLTVRTLPWDPGASPNERPQTNERVIPAKFGPP